MISRIKWKLSTLLSPNNTGHITLLPAMLQFRQTGQEEPLHAHKAVRGLLLLRLRPAQAFRLPRQPLCQHGTGHDIRHAVSLLDNAFRLF